VRAYADSSFILRLVTMETDSPATIAEYRRLGKPPMFFLPLDLLEVRNAACALTLESELFLTTDGRQAQLAQAEGLKAVSAS